MKPYAYPDNFYRTEVPSTFGDVCAAGGHPWDGQAMTPPTPESPLQPVLHPDRQQYNELKVIESTNDDISAAVDIRCLHATAYKRLYIYVKISQIEAVQHPPRDVEPAHAAEIEGSFCNHSQIKALTLPF